MAKRRFVKKLQQQLKEYYQQSSQMQEFLVGRKSKIADSFINLLLLEQREVQTAEQQFKKQLESVWDYQKQLDSIKHQSIKPGQFKPGQLFTQQLNNQPVKRVIVYGRAGIGKSVLCQYLATQWANDANQTMAAMRKQFELVFWLKLRDLVSDYPQPETSKDADTIIFEFIKRHCRVRNIGQAALLKLLEQHAERTLFILDGYDEIADSLPNRTDLCDVVSQLYDYGHVLLTSRPLALQKIGNSPLSNVLELECIGFRDEEVVRYIKQFMQDSQKSELAEQLLSFIKIRPPLWSMMHIPINCLLVCFLWSASDLKDEQSYTLTQLYTKIIERLLAKQTEKFPALAQTCEQQILGKVKEQSLGQLAIRFLSVLAYKGMQQNVIVFKDIEPYLQIFIKQYKPKLQTVDGRVKLLEARDLLLACYHLGLLKPIQEGIIKRLEFLDQAYYFIHLSFQEYLAADYYRYYLQQPTTQEAQRLIEQVIQVKYEPLYQLMWRFVAGLLYQQRETKGTTGLLSFFQALLAKPREEIGFIHLKLMAHCLDECQADKNIPLLAKLLEQQQSYLLNSGLREVFDGLLADIISACFFTGKLLIVDKVNLLKATANKYQKELAIALVSRGELSVPDLVLILKNESIVNEIKKSLVEGMLTRNDVDIFALLSVLKNESIAGQVRGTLAFGLSKRVDVTVSELVSVLEDKTIDIYIRGELAISLLTRNDVDVSALFSMLKNESIAGQIRGALAFGLSKRADIAVSKLVSVLEDETIDRQLRGELVFSLLKRADITGSELVSMLEKKVIDGYVRGELAVSLSERADVAWVKLFSILQDESIDKYHKFQLAFRLTERADVLGSELDFILKNETINEYSKNVLVVSLAKRGNVSTAELISLLKDKSIFCEFREKLVVNLSKRGDVTGVELIAMLEDESIDLLIRGKLVFSLLKRADITGSELVSMLEKKTISGYVRGQLAFSLSERAEVAWVKLFSVLKDESIPKYSREELAINLARRDDISVSDFVSLLQGESMTAYCKNLLVLKLLERADVPVSKLVFILENKTVVAIPEGDSNYQLACSLALRLVNRAEDIGLIKILYYFLLNAVDSLYEDLGIILFFHKPELFGTLSDFTDKTWLPLLYKISLTKRLLIKQLNEPREGLYWQLSYQGQTIKLPCTEPNFFIDKAKEREWPTSLYSDCGYGSVEVHQSIINMALFGTQPFLSSEIWLIHLAKQRVGEQVMLLVEGVKDEQYFIRGYVPQIESSSSSRLLMQVLEDSDLYYHLQIQQKNYDCLNWLISPDTAQLLMTDIQRDVAKVISHSFNWAEAKLRARGIEPVGDWLGMQINKLVEDVSLVAVNPVQPKTLADYVAKNSTELKLQLIQSERSKQMIDNVEQIQACIDLQQDAESLFKHLAKQGLSWSSLKHICLLAPQTMEARRQGHDVILKLIEQREFLDQQYYEAAVKQLFPTIYYGHEVVVGGEVRDDGTGFKQRYYQFRIFNERIVYNHSKSSLLPHANIIIKAPGSRDLTSDIDTTISVENIADLSLDRLKLPEGWSKEGYDEELLVQCALIYYFNNLNENNLQLSSGESRDSNVYADGFINPRGYPKFDGRLRQDSSAFDFSFDEELKKINKEEFFAANKQCKQQQELAASLVPLLEYFGRIEKDRIVFMQEIIDEWSEQQEAENVSAFNKSIQSAFKKADDYCHYKREALANRLKKATYVSSLPGTDGEKDQTVAAMNVLYVEHLQRLAKKYNAVSVKHAVLVENCEQLQQRLEDLAEAKSLMDENQAQKNRGKRYEQQYHRSVAEFDMLNKEVASLRAGIKSDYKALAELINEQQDLQIRANLFANEAYVNYSAPYHVVQWLQSQGEAKINRKQVVMGSILQQIGFLLLHAEELKAAKRPQGEILYTVSKYGMRVADMLFGEQDVYFGDSIFAEEELKTIEHLRRLGEVKTDFKYRELTLVNNYTHIAKKIKKNSEIALDQKALETTLLVKQWIYKQQHPKQESISLNDVRSISEQELGTRLERDKDCWYEIVKKVILATYASKLEQNQHFWGEFGLKK